MKYFFSIIILLLFGSQSFCQDSLIQTPNRIENELKWLDANEQLLKLSGQGKFAEAIVLGEKNLQFAKDSLGVYCLDYATSLNNLADLFRSQGHNSKALPLYVEAIQICKKIVGESHPDYLVSLSNLAALYKSLMQYEKALLIYQEVLEICKTSYGVKHQNYAICLSNLAAVYKDQGQYQKALPLYEEALNILKNLSGDAPSDYSNCLISLAILYQTQGQYEKALPLYQETLEISKNESGENHQDYAKNLNNLAALYKDQGQYEKALPLLIEALNIQKSVLGKNHPDYANSLNNLAVLYYTMGDYEKALPLYQQAMDIRKKVLGEAHPDYATSLYNLARLYADQGQNANALPLFKQALSIRKKVLGQTHPDYAESLNNLAALYEDQGQYEKALPLIEEATEIYKNTLGEQHPAYASGLNNLAEWYNDQGDYEKALPLYQTALEIHKKVLGENHPDYARSLNNLAALYKDLSQYEKALPLYQEALAICKKTLGGGHPDCATSLNNLAQLYYTLGQYDKALPLFLEAITLPKNSIGEQLPEYANSLNNLALLYAAQRQYDKALPLLQEGYLLFQKQIQQGKTYLSEKELNLFLKKEIFKAERLNSVALQYPADDLIKTAYNTAILLKGISLQNSLLLKNSIGASANKQLRNKYQNFILLKKNIAIQEKQSNTERKVYDSMVNKSNELEVELMRLSPEFQSQLKSVNIKWQDIQKNLGPEEAAIEFVDFNYYDKRWADSVFYAAYILRKGWTAPKMIQLFEKRQLDALLVNHEKSKTIYNTRGIKKQLVENTANSSKLYKLIWQPLKPYLENIKTVFLSPSGLLYKISFNAIATPDNLQLMDKFNIHIVSCTRIIAADKTLNRINFKSSILYGGIDYDHPAIVGIKQKDAVTENLFSKIKKREAQRETNDAYRFLFLPGTAAEVMRIQAMLKSKNMVTKTYKKSNASEESFKQLGIAGTAVPEIIHLATHGFAFDQKKLISIEHDLFLKNKTVFSMADDPLLRTGLIMAGANKSWVEGISFENREDGILTALEISNVNLKGCKLAVLSACETGLGDIKGSEGVYGLQRAFKMAGVEKIIVSLWSVNDAATQNFMTNFYKQLIETNDIVKSFNLTQQRMRKKYKDPYYWAGFILIE